MKRVFNLGKRWRKNSPGFTLVELMVAMAVGSLVMGGVFAVWTQLFHVTATNSNYMAAFREVQNSGDWISGDTAMTQQVYPKALTELVGSVGDADTTITVDSTADFPASGVICIEDEIIQYAGRTATQFTDCTRGLNSTTHDAGQSVTIFLALDWSTWSGSHHQVIYCLRESSQELVRGHIINDTMSSTDVIARAISLSGTTSTWDYDDKELTVTITAQIGSEVATRTYLVNPRPLF